MRHVILASASALMAALAGCSSTAPSRHTAALGSTAAPAANAAQEQRTAASPASASDRQSMAATNAAAEATLREQQLWRAQRTLKAEGFYKGPIDGKSGPLTIAAIEAFQKKHDLKPTGWLDQATTTDLEREASAGPQQHASTTP